MTIEELREKVRLHGLWLAGDPLGSRANLSGAELYGANLSGAELSGADLQKIIHLVSIVPEVGSFSAFKAARCTETDQVVVVQLSVPATARRLGGLVGRKCRVSAAKVVSITTPDGAVFKGVTRSDSDATFIYSKGQSVIPDSFDDDTTKECSHGIHVFLTRMEAIEYLAPDIAKAMLDAMNQPT